MRKQEKPSPVYRMVEQLIKQGKWQELKTKYYNLDVQYRLEMFEATLEVFSSWQVETISYFENKYGQRLPKGIDSNHPQTFTMAIENIIVNVSGSIKREAKQLFQSLAADNLQISEQIYPILLSDPQLYGSLLKFTERDKTEWDISGKASQKFPQKIKRKPVTELPDPEVQDSQLLKELIQELNEKFSNKSYKKYTRKNLKQKVIKQIEKNKKYFALYRELLGKVNLGANEQASRENRSQNNQHNQIGSSDQQNTNITKQVPSLGSTKSQSQPRTQKPLDFRFRDSLKFSTEQDQHSLTSKQQEFVIQTVQKVKGLKVQSIKQICSFQKDFQPSPQRVHRQIDNKPNTLMLVKLSSGNTIGAYLDIPMSKNHLKHDNLRSEQTKSCLMKVSKGKSYQLKKPKGRIIIKPYLYEEDYIIYGNSDLRVNIQKRQVESHFGNSTASFDDRGQGPLSFIEPGQRGSQFKQCNIFQVKFEGEQNVEALFQTQESEEFKTIMDPKVNLHLPQLSLNRAFELYNAPKQRPKLDFQQTVSLEHHPEQFVKPNIFAGSFIDHIEDEQQRRVSKKQSMRQEMEKLRQENQNLKQKGQHLANELNTSRANIDSMKMQLEVSEQKKDKKNYDAFFAASPIFSDNKEERVYITDLVQKQYGLEIKETRLVYRYDPLSKINIHEYVDNVPNFILIIKTTGGQIIGGFSKEGFRPGNVGTDGFIFTASKKTDFQINPRSRGLATTHDAFYLIFGNSELRIKTQDKTVFSNFGIVNNYFLTNDKTVDFLLNEGKGKREAVIETYQAYQIMFHA